MSEKQNDTSRSEKTTVYVSKDCLKKCDASLILTGARSRSDFFEQAVNFYTGYIASENHKDFLALEIQNAVSTTIKLTENRISRLMFKEAVELSKLVHMLSSLNDLDDETLQRLHIHSVNEVKRLNGAIKLEDSVKFHREN